MICIACTLLINTALITLISLTDILPEQHESRRWLPLFAALLHSVIVLPVLLPRVSHVTIAVLANRVG